MLLMKNDTLLRMLIASMEWHKSARSVLTIAVVCLNIAGCATGLNGTGGAVATTAPGMIAVEDEFCPPPNGWFAYVVQPGDTLAALAERTSSTLAELAAANCVNNPRQITVGTTVYVPQRIE
jgi:hypothetical protein